MGMKARRTLRSLGEGGSGRGFREFRKIPRSVLRGASFRAQYQVPHDPKHSLSKYDRLYSRDI